MCDQWINSPLRLARNYQNLNVLICPTEALAPGNGDRPIAHTCHPEEFAALKRKGQALGFRRVSSGPLVCGGYHADA